MFKIVTFLVNDESKFKIAEQDINPLQGTELGHTRAEAEKIASALGGSVTKTLWSEANHQGSALALLIENERSVYPQSVYPDFVFDVVVSKHLRRAGSVQILIATVAGYMLDDEPDTSL
jgi:hypothetical protein